MANKQDECKGAFFEGRYKEPPLRIAKKTIPPTGIEPVTSALGKPRSIQLSYEGIDVFIRFRIDREHL
jgi:hypothetical protein